MDAAFIIEQLSVFTGCDEAYVDYIVQLVEDDTMETDEKRSIIMEFLSEAVGDGDQVSAVVSRILAHGNEARMRRIAEAETAAASAAAEAEAQRLAQAQTEATNNGADAPLSTKKVLSKEEKRMRERLLRQYGYEVDEAIENEDGEVEFVYSGGGSSSSKDSLNAPANTNMQRVKDAEAQRKAKMSAAHAEKVQRDKDARARQLAEAEKKKKGTQKQEKRRM
ncbi:hypothetical protein BC830DRAFT_1085496 [Chytriomyces sp. MP71]|nr:hypothetical protein BC830DRAFT_1085496 [Chytriomyces sp. MP71]